MTSQEGDNGCHQLHRLLLHPLHWCIVALQGDNADHQLHNHPFFLLASCTSTCTSVKNHPLTGCSFMNSILCAASTYYTKDCALRQFRICQKCVRTSASYTLFRSKMWKELAQQTCVSLCPSPDVEKAPLHPLVALFCPSEPPDVADHTDAEELPVLVSIQLFPPTISGWSTILVSLLFISITLLCY